MTTIQSSNQSQGDGITKKFYLSNQFLQSNVRRDTWIIPNGNQIHVGQTIKTQNSEYTRDLCLTKREAFKLIQSLNQFIKK